MNWLNLELTTLRSEQFLGSEPVERATWLCLMAYCADQENGGVIDGADEWGDRKWMQLVGVTAKETRAPSLLWHWKGSNLALWGYPVDKQSEVQRLRSQAKNAARKRWGNAKAMPQGMPKGNGSGNAEVEVEVEVEGNKKDARGAGVVKKRTRAQSHDDAVNNMVMPDELTTQEFCDIFGMYLDERRAGGKYATTRSIKVMLNKLSKVPVEQAIEAVENSIANGWQGVFPERNKAPKELTQHYESGQVDWEAERARAEASQKDGY